MLDLGLCQRCQKERGEFRQSVTAMRNYCGIHCPTKGQPFRKVNLYDLPPAGCPYAMEHRVSMQAENRCLGQEKVSKK